MASACMAIVRHRRGSNPVGTAPWYPTPRFLRAATGDTEGGTTLTQADYTANRYYDTNLDVRTRYDWIEFRNRIQKGEGAILQGAYSAFHGTRYDASGSFMGNHAVYVNELRWADTRDRWEFLMYDPLADGRRASVYTGPIWIDEKTLKTFAGRLQEIAGGPTLGYGKVYAAFTRDTEDVIVKFSAKQIPLKTLAVRYDGVNVRRTPRLTSDVAYKLNKSEGDKFNAYQVKTDGPLVAGSRKWYGDRDGIKWVAAKNFVGE